MIIIIFICILAIIIIYRRMYPYIAPDEREKTIDVVIARYNENLDWFKDEEPYRRVIVYNKGNEYTKQCEKMEVIQLENVGRDFHTYLYHIIHNYDNLADVTICLVGCSQLPNKIIKTNIVLEETMRTRESVFPEMSEDPFINSFSIDEWISSDKQNAALNGESKLLPCPERPFSVWYEKNFGHPFSGGIVYNGIFSMTREKIQNRPISFYEQLIRYVDHHSSPEAVHYLERAWYSIFK